jgi:hypothetical protein
MEEVNLFGDDEDDDDDDDDDEYDYKYDDHDSSCDKKKRRYAEADNEEGTECREDVVDESREEVEGEGMVRTRVTFNRDSRYQVHDPLLAQSHSWSQSSSQSFKRFGMTQGMIFEAMPWCDNYTSISQNFPAGSTRMSALAC